MLMETGNVERRFTTASNSALKYAEFEINVRSGNAFQMPVVLLHLQQHTGQSDLKLWLKSAPDFSGR